jgi:YqjK-like protein
MSSETNRLAARRHALLERSSRLRSRIADDVGEISEHLRIVDRATSLFNSRGGRIIVLGGMVLILMTGPGRALKAAGRAAIVWSLVRRWLPRAWAVDRGRHRA